MTDRPVFILYGFSNVSNEFKPKGLRQKAIYVESPVASKRFVGWLKGCLSVIRCTKTNDIIFCWYDFQAVMLYWMCLLTGMRRRLCCLNLLLKKKDTALNRIVRTLYRKALISKNFHASVTSPYYGERLKQWLDIDFHYIVIHDLFHENWIYESTKIKDNSVFVGGRNGRDWPFMLEVAQKMEHVNFLFMMEPNDYEHLRGGGVPSNVEIRTSVTFNEFMQEMANSCLVCLPLNTEAPAGLMVVFQAAGCKKPVLITKTVTSEEYVTPERGCPLERDIEEWVSAIDYYLKHADVGNQKAMALYDFCRSRCGIEQYSKGIQTLIDLC